MRIIQSRRDFLASASLAAAAGVLGARRSLADEGPPEDDHDPARRRSLASASRPEYVAEELLRAEGFTDIRYVPAARPGDVETIARGEIDFGLLLRGIIVPSGYRHADHGVGGVHAGCFELFAHEPIRTIGDLKGKRVGVGPGLGPPPVRGDHGWHMSGSTLTRTSNGSPGLDPASPWSCSSTERSMPFSAFLPEPQELRARKIGRVILNTATDRPWSQYFCCMLRGQRGFRPRPSGRDQARGARHPQSQRHLRRRAGAGRAASGRWRVRAAVRLCAPDADRDAVRQLARVRPRGLAAVLCAAAARGRA